MKYRSDLQVLRGIAIILVIGYHISSEIFRSGFLGVDIFFVLSGFLITKIYQNYTLKKYIINRAKRLLPAYFISLLFTIFLSFIFLNLKEFNEVIREYFFAITFLSNFGFWIKNSYFNNTNFYPLLHFWSLAIEVQFYIIYPLIFYFLFKKKFLIITFLLLSLLCCIIILNISPKTAFYLLPFRIWEFIFGVLITKININKKYINLKINYLIFIPIIYICFTKTTYESHSFYIGHPGLKSILICFLTSLIILLKLPEINFIKLLNILFEKIGLISYSLYLYHFPIIIFFNYIPYEGNKYNLLDYKYILILLPLILIPSILSYIFIEKYFKKKSLYFIFCIFFLSLLSIILLKNVKLNLYSEKEINIYNSFNDKGSFRCGKIFRIINPHKNICKLNKYINGNDKFLIIGNSHANALKDGMINVMNERNKELWITVQNDPLMDATIKSLKPIEIFEISQREKINNFIIHYDNFFKFKKNIKLFIKILDK